MATRVPMEDAVVEPQPNKDEETDYRKEVERLAHENQKSLRRTIGNPDRQDEIQTRPPEQHRQYCAQGQKCDQQ